MLAWQRFDDHRDAVIEMRGPILQACVAPYRRNQGRAEICLITSLRKQHWILPKGIVDPGETHEQTALKEAFEEAGLRGRIVGDPLGTYEDNKWGCRLIVTVLMMEVTKCEEHWPEEEFRQRRWVSAADAARVVSKPTLRMQLRCAAERTAGK